MFTLFLDPQINWMGPWIVWKKIYVKTLNKEILSSKFDNLSTTFFAISLVKKWLAFRLHSDVDTYPWTLQLIEKYLENVAKQLRLSHYREFLELKVLQRINFILGNN